MKIGTLGILALVGVTSSLAACGSANTAPVGVTAAHDGGPTDAHADVVSETSNGRTCAALNEACSASAPCCGAYVCSIVAGPSRCLESILPPVDGGCTYTAANNDARCPANYAHTFQGEACSPIGLSCSYPGAGDGTPNGCASTAILSCHGDGGAEDSGADAGTGTWSAAQ